MKNGPSGSHNAASERLLGILLSPWFLAAAVVVLLLGVSGELDNLIDEAIWEYTAWLWAVHGDPPYVGSFENKPAGIFLLYRVCYAIFGLNLWPVRVLGVAAIVGTMFLLHAIGRRCQGRVAGAMAALVFGLSAAHHVTDGYMLAVTESFMTFFTALALWQLVLNYLQPSQQSSWRSMFGIGAALGAALCFKQIALADVVGLAPLYWLTIRRDASLKKVLFDVLLMLLGGSVVTGLGLAPLLASGVTLGDYWNGAWGILFSQSHALPTGERLKLIFRVWTNPAVAAYYPLLLLFLFQKTRLQKAGIPFWCLLFWLGMAFLGANASNVYRHQLKQVMLPFSLVAGLGIGITVDSAPGFTIRWLFWLYMSIVAAFAPFNSVLIGMAKQFLPNVMSSPGAIEEQTNHRVAEYICRHTDPSDCVYIWTINSHPIHLYAQRRSSCRYFNAIFRFAPDFESTSLAELAARPPKLIVVSDPIEIVPPSPPWLVQLLARSYKPVQRIDAFEVYERSD